MFVVIVSPSSHIGHYVSAQLDPSQSSSSELVITTYSTAAYICNYTFSYQVRNGAELVLRDSSGTVIWSSGTSNTWQWVHVTLRMEDVQYLTDQLSDELQFVLVRPPSVNSGTLRVFLDDVNVDFCLPCDFQQLQSSGMCSVLIVICILATSVCIRVALYNHCNVCFQVWFLSAEFGE